MALLVDPEIPYAPTVDVVELFAILDPPFAHSVHDPCLAPIPRPRRRNIAGRSVEIY
jgi:hypothetical protein